MKTLCLLLITVSCAAAEVTAPRQVVDAAVAQVVRNKAAYMQVSAATGLRWELIGCIHYREASNDLGRRIQDGRRITGDWVPDASEFLKKWMHGSRHNGNTDALVFAEAYNGFGYRRHGVSSPYVWAGTSAYIAGKFTADGKFDSSKVDAQLGVYVLLRALEASNDCKAQSTKTDDRGTPGPSGGAAVREGRK